MNEYLFLRSKSLFIFLTGSVKFYDTMFDLGLGLTHLGEDARYLKLQLSTIWLRAQIALDWSNDNLSEQFQMCECG